MPWRNWSPVLYGGVFGALAGGVGAMQVIAVVRDFAAQSGFFAKRFPPGYTGFKDTTNLVPGGEWNFVGTAFEALGVIAILLIIGATRAVVATRKSHTGVVTTLIAGVVSTIICVVASVIALSTGFHPMAPYQDSWQNSIPGCVAVSAITALCWPGSPA